MVLSDLFPLKALIRELVCKQNRLSRDLTDCIIVMKHRMLYITVCAAVEVNANLGSSPNDNINCSFVLSAVLENSGAQVHLPSDLILG